MQIAAQQDGPPGQGDHLRRRRRLLGRVDSLGCVRNAPVGHRATTRTTSSALAAVGKDPRPPAAVEDGGEPAQALRGVPAAQGVEAHVDGLARVALARASGMGGEIELGSHVLRHQVEVLGVAGDVGPHERAEREDRQPVGARLRERRANELGAEALALEARVDQRVDEGDQPRAAAVLGEAGDLPVDTDLEARAFRRVDDATSAEGAVVTG